MDLPPLLRKASEYLEMFENNQRLLVFIEAPTSYGKTMFSPYLYGALRDEGLASSYIHVLPLRALVKEAVDSILHGFSRNIIQHILGVEDPSRAVGYQAMALSISGKSPYYTRELVYTTLHSFLLNVFRIPVAEVSQKSRHFELPRSYILSSITVFDEAHLYGGLPPFYVAAKFLVEHGVPVVVETATPSPSLIAGLEAIAEEDNAACIELSLEDEGLAKSCMHVRVDDRDFENRCCSMTWSTEVIRVRDEDALHEEIVEKAVRQAERNLRTLVVLNTPEKTVLVKRRLEETGIKVRIIHGRMLPEDREASIKLYREGAISVLVGTQAVEAGLNLDFDSVITAPATPSSLIQRAGRASRRGAERAFFTIVHSKKLSELGPYSRWRNSIEEMLKRLKGVLDAEGEEAISWRCPMLSDQYPHKLSYRNLLEWEPREPIRGAILDLVRLASSPLIGSQHVNKLFREEFCRVFGENLLVLPVEVMGMGEVPVGIRQLAYFMDRGVDIELCIGGKCAPLSDVCPGCSDIAKLCRCLRGLLHRGEPRLRVPRELYRWGEGLVLE